MAERHVLFKDSTLLLDGSLEAIVAQLHDLPVAQRAGASIFTADTGRELDVDLRGTKKQAVARYASSAEDEVPAVPAGPRGRGRPKLGVVGREITLLPRHWQWLDTQRGGASAALRRLVDQARKEFAGEDAARAAQDRTNRLLTSLAGDLAGFEDAIRALYARDKSAFSTQIKSWPVDLKRISAEFSADAWVDFQAP